MRLQEISRSEAQQRAVESDRRAQLQFAAWERREASNKARDEYVKHIFNRTFRPGEAVADPRLDEVDREHLMVFNEQWADRLLGNQKQSNPKALADAWERVLAPEGTPGRISTEVELYPLLSSRQVAVDDYNRMRVVLLSKDDPQNRSTGQRFWEANQQLKLTFSSDIQFSAVPGGPEKASRIRNLWAAAVLDKIDARRADPKKGDPADLFDPRSKDYVLDPRFVAPFVQAGKQDAPVVSNETEFQDLPPGTTFIAPDGTLRRKPSLLEMIPQ
jgi:hypothetical protein